MNIQEFYSYIKHPELLNETSLHELNEVIQRYPYFQAAHMLYLKNLSLLNDDRYQAVLTQTSIYAPNRQTLYYLIHSTITQENKEKEHNELTNNLVDNKVEFNTRDVTESITSLSFEDGVFEPLGSEVLEQKEETESIADKILKKINETKRLTVENEQIDKNEILNIEIKQQDAEASSFTFDEWLYYLSTYKENNSQKNIVFKEKSLIDQFLENASSLTRIKAEPGTVNEDLTEQLIQPEELEIVSESLAQLYFKQGHLDKALKMYEKLILKYPEKSIYFASSIQEIKNKLDKS